MAIDEAIDDLVAALAQFGLAAPQPPSDLAAIEAIERAVAPLTLPSDLRRFWERVDPQTLARFVEPGPPGCQTFGEQAVSGLFDGRAIEVHGEGEMPDAECTWHVPGTTTGAVLYAQAPSSLQANFPGLTLEQVLHPIEASAGSRRSGCRRGRCGPSPALPRSLRPDDVCPGCAAGPVVERREGLVPGAAGAA